MGSEGKLVGVKRGAIEEIIIRGNHFGVILIHHGGTFVGFLDVIQGIDQVREFVAKGQSMDGMLRVETSEITEERIHIMDVHVVLLEALSRCNMEIPCHFIDRQVTVEIAPFIGTFFQVIYPPFSFALLDSLGVVEGPPHCPVCLANGFARIAAATSGGLTTVAAAAVVVSQLGGQRLDQLNILRTVVPQNCFCFVGQQVSVQVQSHFEDVVCNVLLVLACYIHHVKCQQMAGNTVEGDVEIDSHFLGAHSVHHQVRHHFLRRIVHELGDKKHKDQRRAHDRHCSSGISFHPEVV
eukprot:Lithocolla_globosa_v1_NODE_5670_length_1203_cov_30.638502.p2 type:complete len:295 gc:universal NODE_5670_length_1203_cov_30.638502:975-91(-)